MFSKLKKNRNSERLVKKVHEKLQEVNVFPTIIEKTLINTRDEFQSHTLNYVF